ETNSQQDGFTLRVIWILSTIEAEKIVSGCCGLPTSGNAAIAAVLKPRLSNAEREAAMNDTQNEHDDHEDAKSEDPPRIFNAEEIFAGKREVWIELDGVRYRLRITRRGKLILQK